MKRAAIIVVAVIVVAVGVFIMKGSNPSTPPPQNTPPPPAAAPTPIPSQTPIPTPTASPIPTPTQPATIEQKISSLQQAVADVAATRRNRELTLTFTEAEVNTAAGQLLTQAVMPKDLPVTVKSVRITFETGNSLLMEAQTTAYGFNVTLKVKAQVGVAGGKPDVQVTDINFGLPFVPQSTKDQIVALIKQKTDEMLTQLTRGAAGGQAVTLEFTRITIQTKDLVVTVNIKPA